MSVTGWAKESNPNAPKPPAGRESQSSRLIPSWAASGPLRVAVSPTVGTSPAAGDGWSTAAAFESRTSTPVASAGIAVRREAVAPGTAGTRFAAASGGVEGQVLRRPVDHAHGLCGTRRPFGRTATRVVRAGLDGDGCGLSGKSRHHHRVPAEGIGGERRDGCARGVRHAHLAGAERDPAQRANGSCDVGVGRPGHRRRQGGRCGNGQPAPPMPHVRGSTAVTVPPSWRVMRT